MGCLSALRTADCGICDNCVKNEKKKQDSADFEIIYNKLLEYSHKEPITARALFDHFTDIHTEHLKKVIDFMQAENKLFVDAEGFVRISG